MSFFSRIKSLITREPEEQIVGYSLSELKSIFCTHLLGKHTAPASHPSFLSLEYLEIHGYYCSFLIDQRDTNAFLDLVKLNFKYENEKTFNELPVKHYVNASKNEHLLYFISNREFNSTTLRLVTNSSTFLNAIYNKKFAVPPPWVAFEGYNPSWWIGNMQGANAYYDDNYFSPFFLNLNDSEKTAYLTRYNATTEWINSLELMYSDE